MAEETVLLTTEEAERYQREVAKFREMSFTETESDLLASADVRPSAAYSLLLRGCTHRLATLILI